MARKGKSYIQLNIEGFDELLKKIEAAGGSINGAVDTCMRQAAPVQQKELKAAMQRKKVSSSLINRMPEPEIEWNGNACTARVGYHKGAYDPKDLSDGYEAVFINYGTPRIKPRNFIKAAKNKARPQIKKLQESTLNEILEGLKK